MQVRTRHIKIGFWVIDFVLAVLTVLLLVETGQHLFASPERVPAPLDDTPVSTVGAMGPKIASRQEYASIGKSNLFGSVSSATRTPPQVVEEKLPETTLELELLGCVAAAEPEWSFAIIRDKRSRKEETYSIGDFVASDARVEEIRQSEVVISRAGKREILAMTFSETGPAGPAVAPPASRRIPPNPRTSRQSTVPSQPAIRVVNQNLRYINRAKLMEEVSENISSVLSEFRTSSNIVEGREDGLKVEAIGSNPLLSQAGLRPSDIVKSVNGIRVNSLDDVLALGDRLQNAPEIRVVIERDKRHRTLVYKIR